ncbi:MAG: proteasome subunit alpha [bacterium]|jgi:proteasome beta subunit|nr:proteasome subunit alpha [bacterium]
MSEGGDFVDLLRRDGYRFPGEGMVASHGHGDLPFHPTEGTTILAIRYSDGVLVAGDRRATAGNMVLYDRADKVVNLDAYSVMAISGSPAVAFEIARVLEHSFQYYRRRQLQEMSLGAKLRRLSLLIKDNIPMAIQGIGAVIPIFATYDRNDGCGRIYFYDALGAQFESTDFTTTGSGSPGIRGVMYYQNRWGDRKFADMGRDEAVGMALRLLDTAGEYDSATGRYERVADIFPSVKIITASGLEDIDTETLRTLHAQYVDGGPGA